MKIGWLVLLLLAGHLAFADDEVHAGKAQFLIPQGWVRLQNAKTFVLVPEDLPKGKTAYIAVLNPRELDNTMSQWFIEEWKQLQKSYTVIEGGEPQTQSSQAGYETVSTAAKVRNQQDKISLVWLMGAHINNRVERFLFVCDEDTNVERYQKGLTAFLSTLTFEDFQAPQTQ